MTSASLFSGMGGFDLPSDWMGWKTLFQCENNPFCLDILKYYWPHAKKYTDIKTADFTFWRGKIDILTGGFPCQPFSHAGKRGGEDDNRFLWPETIRAVNEIQPRCVVFENVPGLFTILSPDTLSEVEIKEVQLFSEDESQPITTTIHRLQQRIIGRIIEDIRKAGYIFPEHADGTAILLCVPACATGAWHRRDRIWFVAYRDEHGHSSRNGSEQTGCETGKAEGKGDQRQRNGGKLRGSTAKADPDTNGRKRHAEHEIQPQPSGRNTRQFTGSDHRGSECNDTNTPGKRCGETGHTIQRPPERIAGADTNNDKQHSNNSGYCTSPLQQQEPAEICGCADTNTISPGLQGDRSTCRQGKQLRSEPVEQHEHWLEAATRLCVVDDGISGRLDGITVSKWRTESLKAAGNAIRPQVAYEIFKAVEHTLNHNF